MSYRISGALNDVSLFYFLHHLLPRGDVGVEYVLSTPLRVVRGD